MKRYVQVEGSTGDEGATLDEIALHIVGSPPRSLTFVQKLVRNAGTGEILARYLLDGSGLWVPVPLDGSHPEFYSLPVFIVLR